MIRPASSSAKTTGKNIGILTITKADRLTYKLFKFDIKQNDEIVGNAFLNPLDEDKALAVGQTKKSLKVSASSDLFYSIAILILTFLLN